MNQFIVRYLGNVRWWGGGMVERRRRRGRLIADGVQRARTPRDLEIARRQRVRRIVGKGTHREWSAVLPGVQYIPRPMFPSIRPGWRFASGMIVLLCAMLLLVTIVDTIYYVESIELAGAVLVPGDEIYRAAAVDGENIFWINPTEVEDKIRAVPGVQDATVRVELPVSVNVQVVENEPVIVWEQGNKRAWVDASGVVFPIRLDIASLLAIIVDDPDPAAVLGESIPHEVVVGALQLKALRPNIEQLHYDSAHGVSYQDGRNWRGVFGTGDNMYIKLKLYEDLVETLSAMGVHPTVVNVADLETPYYQE